MSDRYSFNIKCPYCKKETAVLCYNGEWGESDVCDWCGKRFKIIVKFEAEKQPKGNKKW